jgi:flagellar basal-body rod protein FlgB
MNREEFAGFGRPAPSEWRRKMSFSDLPVLSMLRTRMQWHQERQRLLAENVANADMPKFQPHDLAPLDFSPASRRTAAVTLTRTDAGHFGLSVASGSSAFQRARGGVYEVRPSGNAVNLEDEMMKVASNQMDYQAAATLYSRSLGLLKLA